LETQPIAQTAQSLTGRTPCKDIRVASNVVALVGWLTSRWHSVGKLGELIRTLRSEVLTHQAPEQHVGKKEVFRFDALVEHQRDHPSRPTPRARRIAGGEERLLEALLAHDSTRGIGRARRFASKESRTPS
jgi:hypothetical protein